MDSGLGRKRVECHSWQRYCYKPGPGKSSSFHLALEQSTKGGPGRDEVSQAGKQGSVMPYKGVWISFLAMGCVQG